MSLKSISKLPGWLITSAITSGWGAAALTGCAGADEVDAPVETAEITAELTTVPTGVSCVKLTSSTGAVSKLNTVTAGSSSATVSLGQLPLGLTTIGGAGYNVACGSVTATTVPTWIAADVSAEILGVGTLPIRLVLVPAAATNVAVDFVQPPVALAVGGANSFTLSAAGAVRAWGSNLSGSLGDGTTTFRSTPVSASAVGTVASISAGERHACAVTSAGALICWGENGDGQLGDGTSTDRLTPVTVIASGVKKVAAGTYHTCALMTDGTVRCTGYGWDGQLGNGTIVPSNSFVNTNGLPFIIDIAVGAVNSCALASDKSVRCWGSNVYGQIGNGTTSSSVSTPALVSSLRGVESLDMGDYHTCARLADATVWCWGYNAQGQVGDGTTTTRTSPVRALANVPLKSVATSASNTCAVSTDGDVYCWGEGLYGANGLGNGSNVSFPTRVAGLTDVLEINMGYTHGCARQASGGVSCWGTGSSGQLGTGATRAEFVPVPVVF